MGTKNNSGKFDCYANAAIAYFSIAHSRASQARQARKGGGNQGVEVAAAMQEVAKRGIIKEDDNG